MHVGYVCRWRDACGLCTCVGGGVHVGCVWVEGCMRVMCVCIGVQVGCVLCVCRWRGACGLRSACELRVVSQASSVRVWPTKLGYVWVDGTGGEIWNTMAFPYLAFDIRLPYDLSQSVLPAMASSLKEGKGRRWSRVPVSSWHLYQYRCSSSLMVERAAISLPLS